MREEFVQGIEISMSVGYEKLSIHVISLLILHVHQCGSWSGQLDCSNIQCQVLFKMGVVLMQDH